MFPKLIVLDTLDRAGKDAYNNVSMMETVGRVPQYLFVRGQEEQVRGGFGHGIGGQGYGGHHRDQRQNL